MSPLRLSGSTSGYSQLDAPAIAGDQTFTLPSTGGTLDRLNRAGNVLQVQSTIAQGLLSTTSNGAPSTITNGVQVFSLSFTPIAATSNILVQTSSIAVSENANNGDRMWVSLWDGTNFIGANSGTWQATNFASGYNASYATINELYSAGSTSARTIQVRAGSDAGAGTVYVNGNSSLNYTGTSAQIRMIVMEVAA